MIINEPHIEFQFSKDGTLKMEAHGFTGAACLAATKPYEAEQGIVASRTEKPEMQQTETQTVKQKQTA